MHFSSIEELNLAIAAEYGEDGTVLVYGDGPVPCPIMLAGEAPGADELIKGKPFTGQAGKNFDEFMKILGLRRDQIYIGNTCKFRPFRVSKKGSISNRPPTTAEIKKAMPFFHEEIRLVAPQLLITLGNTPLHACTGDWSLKVGDVHGTCLHVPDLIAKDACLFALYHPASIIYNPKLKETYLQDLEVLREHVNSVRLAGLELPSTHAADSRGT